MVSACGVEAYRAVYVMSGTLSNPKDPLFYNCVRFQKCKIYKYRNGGSLGFDRVPVKEDNDEV